MKRIFPALMRKEDFLKVTSMADMEKVVYIYIGKKPEEGMKGDEIPVTVKIET